MINNFLFAGAHPKTDYFGNTAEVAAAPSSLCSGVQPSTDT
jgi:hypothetical protein